MRKLLLLSVLLAGLSFAEDEPLVPLSTCDGSVIKVSKKEYDRIVSEDLLQLASEAFLKAREALLLGSNYLKKSCDLGNKEACKYIKELPQALKKLQEESLSRVSD